MNKGFIHNWTSPCAVIEFLNIMLHAVIEKCVTSAHIHTHQTLERGKRIWRKVGKWQHNTARLCPAVCTVCIWVGGYNRVC